MVFKTMEAMSYMDSHRDVMNYSEEDRKSKKEFPSGKMVDEVMKRMNQGPTNGVGRDS